MRDTKQSPVEDLINDRVPPGHFIDRRNEKDGLDPISLPDFIYGKHVLSDALIVIATQAPCRILKPYVAGHRRVLNLHGGHAIRLEREGDRPVAPERSAPGSRIAIKATLRPGSQNALHHERKLLQPAPLSRRAFAGGKNTASLAVAYEAQKEGVVVQNFAHPVFGDETVNLRSVRQIRSRSEFLAAQNDVWWQLCAPVHNEIAVIGMR